MEEAAESNYENYKSFNAFFTRALREDARPVVDGPTIISPADGAISQLGQINQNQLIQAKGRHFTTINLLGGDHELAQKFTNGTFTTIYLSPRDYHRVHMPVTGTLAAMTYIPGDLFSVNHTTANEVGNLLTLNFTMLCFVLQF